MGGGIWERDGVEIEVGGEGGRGGEVNKEERGACLLSVDLPPPYLVDTYISFLPTLLLKNLLIPLCSSTTRAQKKTRIRRPIIKSRIALQEFIIMMTVVYSKRTSLYPKMMLFLCSFALDIGRRI